MGLTFKENCPDTRNSRSVDVYNELLKYNSKIDVYDPWVNKKECFREHSIKLVNLPKKNYYDAVIFLVAHKIFRDMSIKEVKSFGKKKFIIYDAKYIFDKSLVDGRL